MKLTLAPLTQERTLRESRKPYAKSTAAHRNKKAYKRQKKVDDGV